MDKLVEKAIYKAAALALDEGAFEIGIDHLLTAFDDTLTARDDTTIPVLTPPELPEGVSWVAGFSMSREVITAIAPFGGFGGIVPEALRNVLLSGKKNHPEGNSL
jgi:hypothetical protein